MASSVTSTPSTLPSDAPGQRRRPSAATARGTRGAARRGSGRNYLGGAGGVVWLLIVLVPLYWLIIMSLRTQPDFFTQSQWLPSSDLTLENAARVVEAGFWTYLRNSLVVTVAAVFLILVVSLMAAYVIVRSRRRTASVMFTVFLSGLAIPAPAAIIPIYFMITRLELYDSLTALVLPSVAFGIPITVLILVNFLRDVPRELFEAMRVDGATEWRMLWQLATPLTKPALITVGIYNAIHAWNGFLFPLVLTQSPEKRVLPLSLWAFQGEFGIDVPAVLMAVLMSALPLVVLYVAARRQLLAGLTAGFSK